MTTLKKFIAGWMICFKPHVFLTLSILYVVTHSVILVIFKDRENQHILRHYEYPLMVTTLVITIGIFWLAFFVFVIRFELRNELDSLLILFQCSKRGLRILGVVAFHIIFLVSVAILVSMAIESSINNEQQSEEEYLDYNYGKRYNSKTIKSIYSFNYNQSLLHEADQQLNRAHLVIFYKIWLTAILYSFLYLMVENITMFYTDQSLIEFVHEKFLHSVARLTGIDLSDYPAGEMLFNPLVRRRLR